MPEGTAGASFIPKNANRVRKPRTSRRIYVFSYISYVLFFGTLLAVFGTYLYAGQIERSYEEHQQQLIAERSRFSENDIAQVRDLEKRLLIAEDLLNQTNAPSRIFTSLEAIVADSLRFVDLSYERQPGNTVTLTFSGATDTFDAAIFQRDLMLAVPGLQSAAVVDFTYGELLGEASGEGVVPNRLTVTFEGSASASVFPYQPVLTEQPTAAATTTVSATTTTETAATSTAQDTATTTNADNEQ